MGWGNKVNTTFKSFKIINYFLGGCAAGIVGKIFTGTGTNLLSEIKFIFLTKFFFIVLYGCYLTSLQKICSSNIMALFCVLPWHVSIQFRFIFASVVDIFFVSGSHFPPSFGSGSKKIVTDPDLLVKSFGSSFGSDPKHSLFHNANDFK
jgi:hypothetical protein